MEQVIIQGIGFLAFFFVIISFQKKGRVSILLIMLIGLLLFAIHYGLLKAWTGAVMNIIEAGVVFIAYKKDTQSWAKQKFWPYAFIIIYILVGLLTAKTLVNLLPIIAQIFGAIAVWQANPKAIRLFMLVPRPLWFTFNLAVGSYAGMVTEIFLLLSVVIGIVRFDIFDRSKKR
jgi:hypothetical protein